MLTGNSWDFQELQFFYLDPQIRAVAGTINERLLLLIYTIFTVFSAVVFLLHQIFCFQNKLGQLPLETTDLGHNPTSPDVQTQLGWEGRPLGRPRGTRVHTCTTSSQEGKHLKTLTNTSRTKPRGRQKSKMGPGREAGLRKHQVRGWGHRLLHISAWTQQSLLQAEWCVSQHHT